MYPSEAQEAAESAAAWGDSALCSLSSVREQGGAGGWFLGGLRWAASIMGLALVWRLWSPEHRENEVWDFGVRVEGLHVQVLSRRQ